MSGGVDSAVAAHLLCEKTKLLSTNNTVNNLDPSIIGLHMTNWCPHDDDDEEEQSDGSNFYKAGPRQYCSWEQDHRDTVAVCRHLNIPLKHVSFVREYWTLVFEPFCRQVVSSHNDIRGGAAKMPNPDVDCNAKIKFGVMQHHARQQLKADFIATGHYARICRQRRHGDKQEQQWDAINFMNFMEQQENDEFISLESILASTPGEQDISWLYSWGNPSDPLLLSAVDPSKDQSYFLATVSSAALRQVIFPLGHLHKNNNNSRSKDNNNADNLSTADKRLTVRELARRAQLPNASKRDSMGICFIGKRKGQDKNTGQQRQTKQQVFSSFLSQYMEDEETLMSHAHDGPSSQSSRGHQYQFIDVDTGQIVAHENCQGQGSPMFYTIGQGARLSGASKKWFIVGRDDNATTNSNVHKWLVCAGTDHPALFSSFLTVRDMFWMGGLAPTPLLATPTTTAFNDTMSIIRPRMRARVRLRHLQPLVDCDVVLDGDNNVVEICLDVPARAITPGQLAVLYVGPVCLGGGIICEREITLPHVGINA